MDQVGVTSVNSSILGHRKLFGPVVIVSVPTVKFPLHHWDGEGFDDVNNRHCGINNHSLENFEANVRVPIGNVIVVRPFEILCKTAVNLLSQVGVHKQNQETCVEELGIKDSTGDDRLLL